MTHADDARDVFAAAALTGLLARGEEFTAEWVAEVAYDLADAMLAERRCRRDEARDRRRAEPRNAMDFAREAERRRREAVTAPLPNVRESER